MSTVEILFKNKDGSFQTISLSKDQLSLLSTIKHVIEDTQSISKNEGTSIKTIPIDGTELLFNSDHVIQGLAAFDHFFQCDDTSAFDVLPSEEAFRALDFFGFDLKAISNMEINLKGGRIMIGEVDLFNDGGQAGPFRTIDVKFVRCIKENLPNALPLLCKNSYSYIPYICQTATYFGSFECLKWGYERGCPWNEITCSNAAGFRHFECLKWAREHGCPWNKATCEFAAQSGDLDCLKWAHEHGCPWDNATCALAALTGHIECLIWAREHGCFWNEETCACAASNGHIDCLIWAREHGCPWDSTTHVAAILNGHFDCLIWARDHGCPWNEAIHEMTAQHGYPE